MSSRSGRGCVKKNALHLPATGSCEKPLLMDCLDALSGYGDFESRAHGQDRRDHGRRVSCCPERAHKSLVDLELVGPARRS
jgi:hypothetical protein